MIPEILVFPPTAPLTSLLNLATINLVYRFLPVLLFLIVLVSFFYLPIKREIAYGLHISGDKTNSCCNVQDVLSQSGKFNESANLAIFDGQVVDYPKTSLAEAPTPQDKTQVLGTSTDSSDKLIEVSLSTQRLIAWEGNKIYMEFPISSGRWFPTPTGNFSIWYKTRFQRMVGGSKDLGTYYDLPNVPNNMFFYQGFAIHGAYWHNNFGHPMSHGCVNAPLAQAAQLFEWAGPVLPPGQNAVLASADNPGTKVYIHE